MYETNYGHAQKLSLLERDTYKYHITSTIDQQKIKK